MDYTGMAEVSGQSLEAAQMALATSIWSLEMPIRTVTTTQRAYFEYKDRFLKRSLGIHEYVYDRDTGIMMTSPKTADQIENEAVALRLIKRHTNIPVPKVLASYRQNGISYLWTEKVTGYSMKQLTESQTNIVKEEVAGHIGTLKNFRSRQAGGLNGLAYLPTWLWNELPHGFEPVPICSISEEFVFCHMNLDQSNIRVNPETLKINAIINWEFAGFYPSYFEGHFYEISTPPERQYKERVNLMKMVEFFTAAKPGLP